MSTLVKEDAMIIGMPIREVRKQVFLQLGGLSPTPRPKKGGDDIGVIASSLVGDDREAVLDRVNERLGLDTRLMDIHLAEAGALRSIRELQGKEPGSVVEVGDIVVFHEAGESEIVLLMPTDENTRNTVSLQGLKVQLEGEETVEIYPVSAISPLGEALMGKLIGDSVTVSAPGGTRKLEIVAIG